MSDIGLRSSIKNPILNSRKTEVYSMNRGLGFLIVPLLGLILYSLLSVTRLESAVDSGRSGETLYKEYCSVCHGDKGEGDGFAAKYLDPKPRDFTSGKFKIRSTISLPTDEDIARVITAGLPGTLMPAFEFEIDLKKEEIKTLVAYVKSFSDAFDGETPEPILIPTPPSSKPSLVEGKIIYEEYGCPKCHGLSGTGEDATTKKLEDSWGNPISAYDFTVPDRMKGGSTVKDVYRTIYTGIGGTPMAAFEDALTDEQYWALAYYVLSLSDSDDDDWGDDYDDWGDESSKTFEGNSITGRDLIMGVTRFKNGGPPCMGCHSVMGIGAFGGGPWGPDLTTVHRKFKEDGLAVFLETIPFPTMGPLFHSRPLTEEERGHLLAFLRSMQPTEVQAVTVRVSPLYTYTILIGILGVISLTFIGLIAGKKNVEVRQ